MLPDEYRKINPRYENPRRAGIISLDFYHQLCSYILAEWIGQGQEM